MKRSRNYKAMLAGLMILCLAGAARLQQALEGQRPELGIYATVADLRDAPPMMKFATVALGGFRGLIANALWIRANQLQNEDRVFEMVQLSEWITKLQPRLKQVWVYQAWNMSYNISVKFPNPEDRWRWVQRGISLLRDEALRYCPDEPLIWRELGWHFLHKMGQDLDDAHFYYKDQWINEMNQVLGTNRAGYLELIDPQTDDARARAKLLRQKYKMDPAKMKETDAEYGPLEWRLPEAHAIYWSKLALEKSRPEELMMIRRNIYQSMLLALQRGRLISSRALERPLLAANLDIIPRLDAFYRKTIVAEPAMVESTKRAHRNFLRMAVELLYTHNRLSEARQWFNTLRQDYPDDPDLVTAGGDLDTFALQRLTEEVSETDRNRTQAIIQGYLRTAYESLALDYDDRAEGLFLMARKIWADYQSRIGNRTQNLERIGLPPLAVLDKIVLDELFDPKTGLDPRLQAIIRSKRGLPAPTNAPPSSSGG